MKITEATLRNQSTCKYFVFLPLLIPFFLLYPFSKLYSQEFHSFPPEPLHSKLKTSETYTIVQDSNLFLWLGTESGVFKYDGYTLKQFVNHNKMIDNSILFLYVDYKNRLWFSTYNGYLGYIQNDSIHNHPLQSSLSTKCDKRFIDNLYIDTNDVIWTIDVNGNINYVDSTLNIRQSSQLPPKTEHELKRKLLHDNYRYSYIFNSTQKDTSSIYSPYSSGNYNKALFYIISKNAYFYAVDNHLAYMRNGIKSASWNFNEGDLIGSIYMDNDSTLWVNPTSKGIYAFKHYNLKQKPFHIFSDITTSCCFQDHEGNHWISTMDKGVYILPSLAYKLIPNTKGRKITTFCIHNDNIFYCPYQEKTIVYSLRHQTECSVNPYNREILINKISMNSKGQLLFNARETRIWDPDKHTTNSIQENSFYHQYLGDSLVLICGFQSLGIYSQNDLSLVENFETSQTINSAYYDENANIWLATVKGLYLYKNDSLISFASNEEFLAYRLNHIEGIASNPDLLWITSKASGLILYNKVKDSVILSIDYRSGLSSNNVKSIFQDSNNCLWVGTDAGLDCIQISYDQAYKHNIKNYSYEEGFPCREIYEIKRHKDNIYLATENGLLFFNPIEIPPHNYEPKPIIDKITCNNSVIESSTQPVFHARNNTFLFSFRSVAFKKHNKLRYRYRLKNYEKGWTYTTELSARYPHLPPGKYVFQVECTIDNKNYSNATEYGFIIQKGILHQWWFFAILFLLFALLLFVVFKYIIKQTRKKSALKFRMYQAERNALKTNINPHFISNSLYSMQDFLLRNKFKDADAYLGKIAKLFRLHFLNSKFAFTPLSQELEALKLYIELEANTMTTHCSYSINVDSSINMNQFKIPSSIIQPIVENAFKHGFKETNSNPKLTITIRKESPELIHFYIEDNGKGISFLASQNKALFWQTQTSSLQNIKKQIELLNKMFASKMNISVRNKETGGTIVELTLLCIYE